MFNYVNYLWYIEMIVDFVEILCLEGFLLVYFGLFLCGKVIKLVFFFCYILGIKYQCKVGIMCCF